MDSTLAIQELSPLPGTCFACGRARPPGAPLLKSIAVAHNQTKPGDGRAADDAKAAETFLGTRTAAVLS
jgi:hypothetical protein